MQVLCEARARESLSLIADIHMYRICARGGAYKAIVVKEIENYDKLILPFRFDYFQYNNIQAARSDVYRV